jgi:hypothetical protein
MVNCGSMLRPIALNRIKMNESVMTEKTVMKYPAWRIRLVGLAGAGSSLVALASAGDINDSMGPILDSLPTLFESLVGLIIAAVPIMVILAIVGFILGLFAAILGNIRV